MQAKADEASKAARQAALAGQVWRKWVAGWKDLAKAKCLSKAESEGSGTTTSTEQDRYMDHVLLDQALLDRLSDLASPELGVHAGFLPELEGLSMPVARVDPAEIAESYQVRGEIARSANKNVYGHAEFVSLLRRATSQIRIGGVNVGRMAVVLILEADTPSPLQWMVIEDNAD
jgi:hypothetical protein